MADKKIINMQVRMQEIGIASIISHNLAKYISGVSSTYSYPDFIRECSEVMKEVGLPDEQIRRILEQAIHQVDQETSFFRETGRFLGHGGSDLTPTALLFGPLMRLKQLI